MKNLGIILIIVGALLLVLCAAIPVPAIQDLADQNWYTIGSFVLIIIGLLAHIFLNKKVD